MTIAAWTRGRVSALVLLTTVGGAASGGTGTFSFTPAARYANDVPTPAAVLGHALGARFSTHEQVGRVVEAIGLASDRVTVSRYGETWAGRPLYLALVSSPANLARIEAIGDDIRLLEDPRRDVDGAERDRIVDSTPAICWLSYSVHGNEASGTEAALATLYHLAAAEDEEVARMLEDVVVVVDPCLNPDGRERYVQWYRSVLGATPDPDPQAIEHREPWPGGRVNHYHFDLNRDWAFLTQVESRARLRAWRRLPPQVHADLHEMMPESSYFFFPAAPPFNQNLPADVRRWGEVFGAANAAAFDRFGWTYFTEESFDLLYPGYGDSWPSLNSAIGMTYEQAGHGRAGLVIRRGDGTLLTLEDRVAHHFTAAIETVATTARHRRGLLERFARWHEDALWEGREGPVAAYVFERQKGGHATDDLVRLLRMQGIEVSVATEPFAIDECHPFDGGEPEARRFAPGTVVVPLDQPRKRLAKALLEPRAAVRENTFYDVSAWSLPLAFGVRSWWSASPVAAALDPIESVPARSGAVLGADPAVGWIVAWDAGPAARFAERATRDGVLVRTVGERFSLGSRTFEAGALFVPTRNAVSDVAARVEEAARATGVVAVGVDTGLTREGPDLGSNRVRAIAPLSLAVITGDGTSANSSGAYRYLFERRLEIPFTALPLEAIGRADLARYNVLVLPDGSGYRRTLGDRQVESLKAFLERGGVVVAVGGAAFHLATGGGGLTSIEIGSAKARADDAPTTTLAEAAARRRERNVPGTLFHVTLDPDDPLSFGLPDRLAVMMDSTRAFRVDGPGRRWGRFGDASYLSGYATPESVQQLADQAYVAEVTVGRGRLFLFAGDPTFRGFTQGQTGLLLNAIIRHAQDVSGR